MEAAEARRDKWLARQIEKTELGEGEKATTTGDQNGATDATEAPPSI